MVTFGQKPLFEDLEFSILEGDKIALVGKNGAGKSTLMNVITGARELDDGERFQLEGTKIGYLQQEITPKPGQNIRDFVREGIEDAQEELDWRVDVVLEPLQLDPEWSMDKLSGGQLRRAALARALVEAPDILMLDEPTNHLDLDIIEWLEGYLQGYRGAVLCVSHDRTFLSNMTDKVFWLDRGRLRVCPHGFAKFEDWQTMLIEQEGRELKNRQKFMEMEEEWAARGVPARRKRNQRRLEQMRQERDRLKSDVSAYRRMMAKIEVDAPDVPFSSKHVAEFTRVHKHFGEKVILEGFSLKIIKGDRIGVLGKNGSGKTTFLKMLVGEMEPDSGTIKRAKELNVSYFDQKRQELKDDVSLWRTLLPDGGDYIDVMGKHRHVCGYLKDFLFDPADANKVVGALSGGQKNRLLLSKVLANPGNLLILDEPTNDLDMETLDMLEEILSAYKGTLIVVSHDRDFLDQTVSKILAFEGDGVVEGCIGGYTDYLAFKKQMANKDGGKAQGGVVKAHKAAGGRGGAGHKTAGGAGLGSGLALGSGVGSASVSGTGAGSGAGSGNKGGKAVVGKLSFKLQHELNKLPEKIEGFEGEIAELTEKLQDNEFYMKDKDGFAQAVRYLERARKNLDAAMERWVELEELKGG